MNNITLSPSVLGLIRGLGYPILVLVLAYFGAAEHLMSLGVSATVATILAGFLSSFEHYLEGQNGTALFGAATVKR